jgi:hypothetical protein
LPKPAQRQLQACASIGRRSKPGQANPSPTKQIQIKLLGFAWFYSSESGLINGLQPIPNKNFSPRPSPDRQARLRFLTPTMM